MSPRIAIVTGTLQLGGSTAFVFNLSGELVKRQFPCLVISGESDHPMASDFDHSRVEVTLCDERREIFEDRIERTLQRLQEFKPDVVIASLGPFAFEVLRYVPHGVFRIAMVQSDDPNVYRTLEKYAGWTDAIAGVSAFIVKRLKGMSAFNGLAKHYLAYGVPMPPKLTRQMRSPESIRILYVGRLANEQKRVHLFPEVVTALEKAGIPFHWTIAGSGPDAAALANKIKCRGAGARVQFVGTVDYAETSSLFENHDVLILLSDYEGLPLSLLEAMGHGLVPVVSDLESGIRELVDSNSGVLVPVDDVSGFARAIVHLHNNRAELELKSVAARERVRAEFSIEAMTDRWLRVIAKAPRESALWPKKWRVKAPLGTSRKLRHTVGGRWLRRFAKSL